MATRSLVFIFVCGFLFVNSEVINNHFSNTFVKYDAHIAAVLNYLNSTPVQVYNYKHGTLISAHTKADITELTLDVSVDCINNYPDIPCTEKILICNAFVRNTPEGVSQVLNDVKCKPKPEIIIEEAPFVPETNPTEVEANETKSIALSNEAVSSEVGEHFVAVRRDSVPCLGCPFDLNPNVEGVDELVDIALRHLETERSKKQALVRVLKLQQQVVSGVKYILLAEIAPTICSKNVQEPCPLDANENPFICKITYLHKPWISKVKHVINNNCTESQEYFKDAKKDDMNNEIEISDGQNKPVSVDNTNFDRIAESGAIEEMTPSRLEDLESQIIVEPDDVNSQPNPVPSTVQSEIAAIENQPLEDRPNIYNTEEARIDRSHSSTEANIGETTPLTIEQQMFLNGFVAAFYGSVDSESFPGNLRNETEEASEEPKHVNNSSESEEDKSKNTTNSEKTIEATSPKSTSEDSSEEKVRNKRAIPQLEKISPEEKGLVKNLADFAAASLDNIDDDNHKRIILQILGAKKMVGDDGVYYRLIMRMGISQCLEDKPPEPNVNCREKLLENYTKICKVQIYVNDDFGSPKIVKSQCQNIKRDKDNNSNRTNYSRFKREVLTGGVNEINKDSEKVKQLVKEGVTHLNTQLSESRKYKPVEILSASSQLVAGLLYRIKTKISPSDCTKDDQRELEECSVQEGTSPRTCELKVWEKSWLKFRQFTITCENDDKIYKFESDPENFRAKRSIPGGEFDVSKDDEYFVKYIEGALQHLDSDSTHENKLKIHEIISATKQIVAGHIYRIKAKVVVSDCKKNANTERGQCGNLEGAQPKTCDFTIFEQLWVPNSRQTNITCENDEKQHHYRERRQAGLPGGQFDVSNDDEYVVKYLEGGLNHLDSESEHENKFKIHEIVSATQQIVAGHIYRIKAKIILSDCKKSVSTERGRCGTLKDAKPKTCDFVIFEQLWVPNSRETNITCENEQKQHHFRAKRSSGSGFLGNDELKSQFIMFNEYLKKYNKTYTSKKEYKYRLKVFSDNLKYIRMLNTYEQGTAFYGVTKFADLSRKEFSKSLGLRMDMRSENATPFAQAHIPDVDLPTEFDWRQKGAVSEVKNQEQCGSCWAFSVTGNVEGQYAIRHGKLLEFSEQELVDCDTEDQGCNGGFMDNAYRAIEKLGGLEQERDYPYDAEDEKCHFNRSLVKVQLTGALNISHNETDMARWLVANGPISIAINANAMQFYMGGISHPFKFLCNPKNLDHGVLIVGYGVRHYPLFNKTLPYWTIKNSWGTSWGEQGYYRVYRGEGTCGLNQTPSSAIVA